MFSYPILFRELARIESLIEEKTGTRLTFSDGSLGEVRFDVSGLRAGLFVARKDGGTWTRVLRFNPSIILKVGEEEFRPTVAHEYAHAVVHVFSGARPRPKGIDFSSHGGLWRSLMELFGHPPRRCHDYPVTPARTVRTYLYSCQRCEREYRLGPVRHGRLERNPGYLVCGACRGTIEQKHSAKGDPSR
ncbi:MAG: SprT-like domain-containing protein [Leptospirillia bacterium]